MSQINDALRRAGHIAKDTPAAMPAVPPMPTAAPPPPPPLPPPPIIPGMAESELAPRKSTGIQIILAVLLVLCVSIAAAVTFWEKRNRSNTNTKPSSEPGAKKTLPVDTVKATLAAPTATSSTPANVSNPAPTAATPTKASAPAVAAAPIPAPRPVEPVKFPPLRLQSIFFRPSNPSVIINNKTLYVEDQIQGVLVADIQPASVTLVLSGQTNILTLR